MWESLLGKKVAALRGRPRKHPFHDPKKAEAVPLEAILFDDGESYIRFREQDPYDYHDCAREARIIDVHHDAKKWATMMSEWKQADFFDF